MALDLAILSGAGALPPDLARAYPDALCITFTGINHSLPGRTEDHSFERLGKLFAVLKERGIRRVVMAGSMYRPALNPENFDAFMRQISPQLVGPCNLGMTAFCGLSSICSNLMGLRCAALMSSYLR